MTPSSPRGELDPELDARLVERCLAGDRRAWDALVTRHQRLVYSVARSWRLSDEDLGDVFQEVFAALVRGLPRLRDARSLVRWLSSTTDRVARTRALRQRREQALRVEDETVFDRLPDASEPVGADLEALERQATVRLALSGVPERCRRLILALYYEDPTPAYADLAGRLGIPIGSLGPTRARCMEKLRELLGGPERKTGITEPPETTSTSTTTTRRPRNPRGAGPPPPSGPPTETKT
jgi:RNA polymerase sigma factor (sigma-70 family)